MTTITEWQPHARGANFLRSEGAGMNKIRLYLVGAAGVIRFRISSRVRIQNY